ncbi:glycoside hydrolase family 31 protein [uncultured Bacteroides sp.]|uniref:glycoside hydrolase family 31 protein n=1 Tax=uncultured Bacteroides sp. TaxID=162156 RepID=UPI0026036496|nr:glycoside hydrolase family 31 protein [uncultured Bacteroides sp.]
MRTKKVVKVAMFLLAMSACPTWGQNYQKTMHGIKANACDMNVEVQFYSPEIVRIIKSPEGEQFTKESFSVIMKPEQTAFTIEEKNGCILLKSQAVSVNVDLQTGKVAYLDADGNRLLTEKDYGTQFTPVNYDGQATYLVRQAFMLDKNEPIYGLGQLQEGRMNQRNQMVHLRNINSSICIPYMQSIKGYSIFWDNYSPTTFTDNRMETAFDSQAGECADYYFMYGKNADGVMKCMRRLTGEVPMNALWTYGFWQSRERYKSQEELVDVVKKFRQLGVPIDGIIQDWQYWGTEQKDWNAVEFGNPLFPNPEQMTQDVHRMNAHIIASVWPSFGNNTRIHQELKDKKLLLDFKTFPEPAQVYDTYNPEARDIYWNYMNRNLFAKGIDGWWLDATEPEYFSKDDKLNQMTHAGQYRKVFNAFPLVSVGGVYNHQRETTADKRVFILTRSAFAGQQRYAATSWSGDIRSTWDVLRKQIPAGLNFSICGIPYWNTDIGGFFSYTYPEGIKDPAFRELYVRWTQFGTFTPMMRSHGTNTPREIYLMGEKGSWEFNTLEKYINLRYRLLPYIYSTAWNISSQADTYMRPLFMDFAHDPKVHNLDDQYLFGRSLLVAPVTEPMFVGPDKQVHLQNVKTRPVYLPAGCEWYDFWTGQRLEGQQTVERLAPIDIMPLYVKAGTILPIGPKVQYATEKKWDKLEIRIYPGRDAQFVLYEDENDNYNYEKGFYSTISFQWDDAHKTLTIGNRQGQFPGMLKSRKFNIVVVTEGHGNGDTTTDKADKTVTYKGKQLKLQF